MPSKYSEDDFSLILASSVHDMKNSLGMLLGSLEEVISEMDPANQRQANQFATLQYEASRINAELVQLLSVYRLQKQRLPVVVDEHYVAEILEDQLARNETLFATRRIEVVMECNHDLVWYFDGEMIASIINDALVNASRYTKDRILLSATAVADQLEIRVCDNGSGFPKDMLGVQSLHNDAKEFNQTRTNLGLYFATQVAELHQKGQLQGQLLLCNEGRLSGGEWVLTLP